MSDDGRCGRGLQIPREGDGLVTVSFVLGERWLGLKLLGYANNQKGKTWWYHFDKRFEQFIAT